MDDALLSDIIFQIEEQIQSRKTALFVGAGISSNSGIPLASNIISSILEKFNLSEDEKKLFASSNLPFEAFMQILNDYSDITSILDIFDIGRPNNNHYLIADLAKHGFIDTIVTTNFDRLIEQSFTDKNLIEGRDFNVFSSDDDFNNIEWEQEKIKLIKLHGCIKNRNALSITIDNVSKNYLSPGGQNIINYIFSAGKHESVLILGYSCSDHFDVNPHIKSIKNSDKKITLVKHKNRTISNKNDTYETIEYISLIKDASPFKEFRDGIFLNCNTDELISKIAKGFNILLPIVNGNNSNNKELNWNDKVESWYNIFSTKSKFIYYALISNLFFRINDFQRNIHYSKIAFESARDAQDLYSEGVTLVNLASAYRYSGKYQEAMNCLTKGLKIARGLENIKLTYFLLGNLGVVLNDTGRYHDAMEVINYALILNNKIQDKKGHAALLGDLANAYAGIGDFETEIELNIKAMEITISIGDKYGEIDHLGNLGCANNDIRNFAEAEKYLLKKIELSELVGNIQSKANALNNLGLCYNGMHRYKEAIEISQKAIMLSHEIGDKVIQGAALDNLSISYFALKRIGEAIEAVNKAISIFKLIYNDEHPLLLKAKGAREFIISYCNVNGIPIDGPPPIRFGKF